MILYNNNLNLKYPILLNSFYPRSYTGYKHVRVNYMIKTWRQLMD